MKEVSEKYPWVKWFQKDGNWYYRDKEGPLVKGLQSINGQVYYFRFWCKNKTKENKAHIFLTESYLMLQVQTIDG
ncbi:hypothetical protein [Bacillus mycoides]|uniref:hypothetical protein n=1 Tax=Bacillus mycoides TaxID=1405 RepID=UPI000B437111